MDKTDIHSIEVHLCVSQFDKRMYIEISETIS